MPRTSPSLRRRGFTIVDLAAVLTVGAVAAAACALTFQPSNWGTKRKEKTPAKSTTPGSPLANARDAARQVKDATQIRNFIQAMVVFASNNNDIYPLPSLLDRNNDTVADPGEAKNTTANIFSILVYQGAISTEFLVSPAESNSSIRTFTKYQFADPKAAVNPAKALWDPALSADFTEGKTGHISYANLQPSTGRRAMWTNSFNTLEAAAGNRGPEIASVTADGRGMVTATTAKEDSNTYRIHGPKDSWEGNIGYNDSHVALEATYGPRVDPALGKWPTYTTKEGKKVADTLFYDEPDDASGANAFLGIFIKAGAAPSDFKAIWD